MSGQSERITILGTPDFKAFLVKEAKKEGVSMSELVRQRCIQKPVNKDEELLAALMSEVNRATVKAKESLEKGLGDAERVLAAIRRAA
ncbi:MAG: hypothetical protein GY799_10315 [Desulfobulbaceae bacterium]|nr:hypothetical protein [Desulfobulbaceae bacterium]